MGYGFADREAKSGPDTASPLRPKEVDYTLWHPLAQQRGMRESSSATEHWWRRGRGGDTDRVGRLVRVQDQAVVVVDGAD